MIFHILLINLSPIFAENELVKPLQLPFGVPHPVGNSLPHLPQMNVAADYVEDVISDTKPNNIHQNSFNNIKDVARYCPHTEIISRHLNRLCGQPQCGAEIKAALKNYYSLLTNALNYRQDTVYSNVNVVNQLNDINALAQKVLVSRNNNVKVKISFEYELPALQKNKCDELCNALEEYANSMNLQPYQDNDDRDAVKTYNNLLLLQKPRPVLSNYPTNLLTDNQSQRLPLMLPNNYLPNLDSLLNQNAKLPNSNSWPELLPPLPNSEGKLNQNPSQNELPVLQEPVQPLLPVPPTNVLPVPTAENSKYEPLNNIIPLLQNPVNSYPEGPSYLGPSIPSLYQQYLNTLNPQSVLTNSKATENSYPFNPNWIPRPPTYPETSSHNSLQNLPLTVTDPTKVANDNPLTNLQNLAKPEEPYPEQLLPLLQNPSLSAYSNPLQKILPLLQNPTNIDSNPLNSLPSPLNPDYLQNSGLSPQNPLEVENSDLPQYLPSLPSNPLQPADFYPNQNVLPVPQSSTEPYYLQNLLPLPATPKENLYSNPINGLPAQFNPLNVFNNPPNKQPLGYDNSYPQQNLILQPQNGLQTQNLLQNISQSLQSFAGSKSYQEYVNALNRKYFDMQSYQDLNKNYLTNPTEQGADLSNQNVKKAYSTFAISNNNMVLNNKLNELYNKQDITTQLSTENPILSYLAKLNSNLGTNSLSNVYQKPVTNINMDSSQIQQSLNYYQQNSGLNNGLYKTNRDFLNQEIQDASKNYIPNTSVLNSALNPLYNSYDPYLNQLQTNSYNRFQIPNSYYNTNLDIASADKITENYNVQLQHLHRLLAVSNLYKLNSPLNINGVVELTYKLRHDRPIIDPYYYVKYRLPYKTFLANIKNLLVKVPNLRKSPNQEILMGSDVSEASNDLKNVQKHELLKLVTTNGMLVNAKLVPTNNTNLDDNLKIVRRLNANMPVRDIIKSDGNYSKLSGQNNPLANYLKAQQNYLKHVQKSLARNPYNSNPYQTQPLQNNNQLNQQRTYLSNKRQEQNPFMLPRYLNNVITNNYHPSYTYQV